jgi:membrane AbrB-like protein
LRAAFHAFDRWLCGWLGRRAMPAQWVLLLVLSVAGVAALEAVEIPAALLLGPMAAAILVAALDGRVHVPIRLFQLAQGVVGCLIARALPISVLGEMRHDWFLFVATILSVIAVSVLLGWLLARWQVLPGTAAIWGSSPGGATAMSLMAEAYGADVRLVAFMLYLRVMLVAVVASLVSRLWALGAGGGPAMDWWPAVAWLPLAETIAVVAIGVLLGRLFRMPAGSLLVPLALALALSNSGFIIIELPPWLLAVSYALVGWSIGLRFTRSVLVHAVRALPRIAASILTLIAVCGGLAGLLVLFAGVEPLTAYLATSPGGADSVAIIAASTHVDLPFVMAMQACRVLIVMIIGPTLMRFIAGRAAAAQSAR